MTRAEHEAPQHEIGDRLHRVVDEPAEKFQGAFSRETVSTVVAETFDLLDDIDRSVPELVGD